MSSIKLNSNIGIKNIKKFHAELIDVLKKGDELVIDFASMGSVDLSVAHVLLSARKTALGNNGNIKLNDGFTLGVNLYRKA